MGRKIQCKQWRKWLVGIVSRSKIRKPTAIRGGKIGGKSAPENAHNGQTENKPPQVGFRKYGKSDCGSEIWLLDQQNHRRRGGLYHRSGHPRLGRADKLAFATRFDGTRQVLKVRCLNERGQTRQPQPIKKAFLWLAELTIENSRRLLATALRQSKSVAPRTAGFIPCNSAFTTRAGPTRWRV